MLWLQFLLTIFIVLQMPMCLSNFFLLENLLNPMRNHDIMSYEKCYVSQLMLLKYNFLWLLVDSWYPNVFCIDNIPEQSHKYTK